MTDRQAERDRMVETQLLHRHITDTRVLQVMRELPRHLFMPEASQREAYLDFAVPIGQGVTISQPYIVAFMTQALALEPHHRVLEIGTGSGYQAAVLSRLVADVYTIEIIPELGERARDTLAALDLTNVHVRIGDGHGGWPEEAPFDRVIVTAAPADVPAALVEQLRPGGVLAIPVGIDDQQLRIFRRTGDGLHLVDSLPVRFVPMTGRS